MHDFVDARTLARTRDWPSADPSRLTLVVNPIAGRRRRGLVVETIELLRAQGYRIDLRETSGPGDARRLAAESCGGEAGLLVVAGGDGTINEAVNGLAENRLPGYPASPPLAIVPLGTANVLAAEIGLEVTPGAIARTIAEGEAREIALGQVQMTGADGSAKPRLVTLMAGAGFDAHVVENVDLALKRRIGKGAYVWESLRQLFAFDFAGYDVWIDGVHHRAASVVVANARHYGGRYVLAPDARLEDPLLQVCLFGRSGRLNAMRYAAALTSNRLPQLPDIRVLPARQVRIEGPIGDPLQGDGDTIARLPCEISVLPAAMRLVMPPSV